MADRTEAPPDIVAHMRCATKREIDPRSTPMTLALMTRAEMDLSYPVTALKQRYQRARPYAGDLTAQLCEPVPQEARMQTSPSYPSGHAAESALAGYILASMLPAQAADILSRARQYGDERVVCRLHFPSDVRAGQQLAAAVFARQQASASFRADIDRARKELAAVVPDSRIAPCDSDGPRLSASQS